MTTTILKAPFPYPGGKSAIAPEAWRRFGHVDNYVEVFCGSSAVLLARPGGAYGTETINDADGLLTNAYRAIQCAPEETAHWCDWPISEADLISRHLWLKAQRADLTARLMADPDYYDAKIAGWWLWGIASWIGDGWCTSDGPWIVCDGRLVDRRTLPAEERGEGVTAQMPAISASGSGNEQTIGIHAYRATDAAAGVVRQMPEVGARGVASGSPWPSIRGVQSPALATPAALLAYFARLSARLRRVRILCGDWRRAVAESVTINHGTTAIFLDPPYPAAEHAMRYDGDNDIWRAAATWAIEHGDDPRYRLAVCGYHSPETDALFPATWQRYRWQTRGGYGNQGQSRGRTNAQRECVWFSQFCENETPLERLLREQTAG